MPNLSEGLIQQGVVIGREEGSLNTTVKNISSMMKHGISENVFVNSILTRTALENWPGKLIVNPAVIAGLFVSGY